MENNFSHCANLVRESDRDRYLATLFAPSDKRDALFALYAFNTEIVRVRDVAREAMAGEIRLQWWREAVEGKRDSEARGHPVAAALRETLKRCAIAPERLGALIDAHQFDLYDEPMATLADLDRYAEQTQSALFGLAADVLGGGGGSIVDLARCSGIAYAVRAVLLDLPRHAAHRQIFVPLTLLDRHGVNPEDMFAGRESEGLRAALGALRRHGLDALAAARASVGVATPQILPAFLPLSTVGPELRRMARRGDRPLQPARLSRLKRQWLIWRAAHDPRRIFG